MSGQIQYGVKLFESVFHPPQKNLLNRKKPLLYQNKYK